MNIHITRDDLLDERVLNDWSSKTALSFDVESPINSLETSATTRGSCLRELNSWSAINVSVRF